MATIIINLVGKSASAKNYHKLRFLNNTNENIVNLLQKHHVICIVLTTRAMRPGEVEGVDYYYISEEEHMRLRNEGIFQEVSLGTTKYSHCKSELKKLKSWNIRIQTFLILTFLSTNLLNFYIIFESSLIPILLIIFR